MSDARKPKTAPRVVHAAVEFTAAPAVPKRHRTRWILGDPEADATEQEVEEHVRGRRGKDAKPTAERKAKDVERFELLAKATAKVPTVAPRKLYVDKRDGSIGEITTRDLGDKLLEREAISNETAEWVRPKAVLCAVCQCVVEVKVGPVPRTCARHAGKKFCPRGCGALVVMKASSCNGCLSTEDRRAASRRGQALWTPEQRGEATRGQHAKRTPEQRREIARKIHASMTPEQRSERARKIHASMTPEQRSELARRKNAAMTPEQRSEVARKANAAMTPEQRSERARKANTSMTPKQRSDRAHKIHATMTPEQRSNIAQRRQEAKTPETRRHEAMKSVATRRANKAAAEKAGEQ